MVPGQVVDLIPGDVGGIETEPSADDRLVVSLHDESIRVTVRPAPLRESLENARELGVVTGPDDSLFADPDGEPVDTDNFESVHRETRLAKPTMSGQASICAQLHEARYDRAASGD